MVVEELEVRLVEELVIVLHKLLHKDTLAVIVVVEALRIEAVAAAVLMVPVGMVHHLAREQVVLVFNV